MNKYIKSLFQGKKRIAPVKKPYTGLILIGILLCAFSFQGELNDGPYVFIKKNGYSIKWLVDGELIEQQADSSTSEINIPIQNTPFSPVFLSHAVAKPKYAHKYSGIRNFAALSDIHGQYNVLISLLKANRIIDQENNWAYKDGHFVVVGDILDRGPRVTEVLWFLYGLEKQAADAGGKVHILLGNHEIMVLNGDLRYVHDKYLLTCEKFGMSYDQLFNTSSLLGSWLRTKPVTVSINDVIFTHGGFSPEFINQNIPAEQVNELFREKIIDHTKNEIKGDSTLKFLNGSSGPLWYRGYFLDESMTIEDVENILRGLGKSHIVVGHTSMTEITPLFNGRIYGVDSSIKKGESGEILIYESGKFFRGTYSGEKIKL